MIQESQVNGEVLETNPTVEGIEMSLDMDSLSVIMHTLSKNLYADPIGSAIRETTSNGLDSKRRSGSSKPVIVSMKRNSQENYEFSVEDFGTGLDDDDVRNIISKYGKSTKRNSNTELGMFGLGFKAPLAYTSSFYFICRKNGIERKYMMFEGEEVNSIDLLYEAPTKECNGVKVIIPFKFTDRFLFYYKMKEQLCYFEDVIFDVAVNDVPPIENTFVIHRSTDFQWSELANDPNMHICLDNVYYPMDFAKLGISVIQIPIGLRFDLSSGLYPTPNREAIIINSKTRAVIEAKISKVANHFMTKYNDSIVETDNPATVFDHLNSKARYVNFGNKETDFASLLTYSNIPLKVPTIKGINNLDLWILNQNRQYMLSEYENKFTLYNRRFSENKGNYNTLGLNFFMSHYGPKQKYIYTDRFAGNVKAFLRDTTNSATNVYFFKKTSSFTLWPRKNNKGKYDNYYAILQLHRYPRAMWRDVIKDFQLLQSYFINSLIVLDESIITDAWIQKELAKKLVPVVGGQGRKQGKLKGEINIRVAEDLQRFVHNKSCKFVPTVMRLEDLSKRKCLMVYTLHDQTEVADDLYAISNMTKQDIVVTSVSNREEKILQACDIHNVMSITEFMKGKNKPFKRLLTAKLINDFMVKYRFVFQNREALKHVSMELYELLTKLSTYKNKYFKNEGGNYGIYNTMYVTAEDNNLFDYSVFPEFNQAMEILNYLDFMHPMMLHTNGSADKSDGMVAALTNLCKYYRFKVNYDNYNVKPKV